MSDGHRDFLGRVFPAELDEIDRRRQASKVAPLDQSDHQEPTTDLGLTGIAVSGGGIRSASFSLGVIQGLVRNGWFRGADYISTVSGGGYTGSCISSLLNEPHIDADPDNFPLRKDLGEVEGEPLTHLRNGSNYLNPGGLLDRVGLPAVFLRGVILNFLLFLPIIMLAVMLTEWLYENGPNWHNLRWVALGAIAIFGGLVLLYPFIRSTLGKSFGMRVRQGYRAIVAFFLLVSIVAVALIPLSRIILWAVEKPISAVTQTVGQALDPGDLAKSWPWLLSLALVAVFMLIGRVSDGASRLSGKMMLTLFGLLGPVLLFASFILIAALQIDSPYLSFDDHRREMERLSRCDSDCVIPRSSMLLTAFTDRGFPGHDISLDSLVVSIRSIGAGPDSVGPQPRFDTTSVFRVTVVSAAGDSLGPYHLIRISPASFRIYGAGLTLFDGSRDWLFFGTMIALLVLTFFWLDVNVTSPHEFYRDRLSQTFLFHTTRAGDVVVDDELKLSELNRDNTVAPYHIINTALNLTESRDHNLRGRDADFFFFSKNFIGSAATGYVETKRVERFDNHLNLGTAMAISAAAAAPNAGQSTPKSLKFVLTLFNIRLGYWIPNPAWVSSGAWRHRLALHIGANPWHLLKEAVGKLNARGSHVNVSDGGHIENLAIYELLRRRCKLIIAIDGEADESMTFNGLSTLLRFARIDMGIAVDVTLDEIRKDEDGMSQKHYTVGKIHYGENKKGIKEIGYLLYIKSSMTGDEPEYLRAYRAHKESFPHESTADQFFTETQFEAYRALGDHIAEKIQEDAKTVATVTSALPDAAAT